MPQLPSRMIRAVIVGSVLTATAAFAATTATPEPTGNALEWKIIGGLCVVLFAIASYQLAKVDKNQTRLFELHADLDKRMERVETVHDLRGCNEPVQAGSK